MKSTVALWSGLDQNLIRAQSKAVPAHILPAVICGALAWLWPWFCRLPRPWDLQLLEEACQALLGDTSLPSASPSPGGQVEYRRTLVISFFFKFYLEVLQALKAMVTACSVVLHRCNFLEEVRVTKCFKSKHLDSRTTLCTL